MVSKIPSSFKETSNKSNWLGYELMRIFPVAIRIRGFYHLNPRF